MILLLLACTAKAPEDSGPRACNGHPELCARTLPEVALPATHNAMSSAEDDFAWPNQQHTMARQLDDGVRGLLFDTWDWYDEAWLCHGSCELGATPLADGLEVLRAFLASHPDDVLVLVIEDHLDPEPTAAAFEAAGLLPLLYTHDPAAGWPTLDEMVDRGERLVVTNEGTGPPPAWYHDFWALGWDTPYSFTDPAEFSCAPNRGDPGNDLFLVNHWIGDPLPRPENAAEVNTLEVLGGRVEQCRAESGRLPNLVAVDFYDRGDLFEVVRGLNGL